MRSHKAESRCLLHCLHLKQFGFVVCVVYGCRASGRFPGAVRHWQDSTHPTVCAQECWAPGHVFVLVESFRRTFDQNYTATIGMDFVGKLLSLEAELGFPPAIRTSPTTKGRQLRLQLWDTAGQERFRALMPSTDPSANASNLLTKASALEVMVVVSRSIRFAGLSEGQLGLCCRVRRHIQGAELSSHELA